LSAKPVCRQSLFVSKNVVARILHRQRDVALALRGHQSTPAGCGTWRPLSLMLDGRLLASEARRLHATVDARQQLATRFHGHLSRLKNPLTAIKGTAQPVRQLARREGPRSDSRPHPQIALLRRHAFAVAPPRVCSRATTAFAVAPPRLQSRRHAFAVAPPRLQSRRHRVCSRATAFAVAPPRVSSRAANSDRFSLADEQHYVAPR
jgi:hypothetical protein